MAGRHHVELCDRAACSSWDSILEDGAVACRGTRLLAVVEECPMDGMPPRCREVFHSKLSAS